MHGLLAYGSGSLGGALLLLLQEILVVGFGDDVKETAHAVMPQPAQLGAHNFIAPGLIRREVNRNNHSWHSVLLQTQFADIKIVNHVLGADKQFDLVIYWHG